MPRGRPRGETPRAAAAFLYYANMGMSRSLARMHRALLDDPEWTDRVPPQRRLEEWSRLYRWQDRVKELDAERAELKRIARLAKIERTNEEDYEVGSEAIEVARRQIDYLISEGKFGSQATVMLMKLGLDIRRLATGADKKEEVEQQAPNIQIIIETDNTPVQIPGMVVESRPALPDPNVVDITDDN